jgi:hypothetical protein
MVAIHFMLIAYFVIHALKINLIKLTETEKEWEFYE